VEAASESIEPVDVPGLAGPLEQRSAPALGEAATASVSEPATASVAEGAASSLAVADGAVLPGRSALMPWLARAATRARARADAISREDLIWVAIIYMSARVLLFVAAWLQASFGHHVLLNDVANWDGMWYRQVANKGYPTDVSWGQTTLGFFPLFPLTIWPTEHLIALVLSSDPLWWSATIAGLLISCVGGLIASVYVFKLADAWWDRDAARRATLLFIFFPGAVVFSMVYSEGVLLPLVAACLYYLERRRWLTAGILAGFATAVQPVSFVLPVVCLVSALLELHRRRWRLRDGAWRVISAPLLSVSGLGAFALFLWAWTGNPMANFIAQHRGWQEKTDLQAMVHLTTKLWPSLSLAHFNSPAINLNLLVGFIGGILLIVMLALMFRARREISPEAIVWTLGVSFLALTSEYVPPNPRMLITAFPALMVVGRYLRGKGFAALVWLNGVGFIGLSLLTFVGYSLRP
jgi:Mannosyltransferase (PIG-V)